MSEESVSAEFFVRMKEKLKTRLTPKRFEHSLGVSAMAIRLARTYSVDTSKAGLAGLLHDWDKSYDDAGIKLRARELGVSVNQEVFNTMPRLLHGETAAAALHRDYPEIDADVLQAIKRHTAGSCAMSELDMIVYIADAIELTRPYPEMDALRAQIGKVSLEKLFLKTYKQVFMHLIQKEYAIHPDTVQVWNYYVARASSQKYD